MCEIYLRNEDVTLKSQHVIYFPKEYRSIFNYKKKNIALKFELYTRTNEEKVYVTPANTHLSLSKETIRIRKDRLGKYQ